MVMVPVTVHLRFYTRTHFRNVCERNSSCITILVAHSENFYIIVSDILE